MSISNDYFCDGQLNIFDCFSPNESKLFDINQDAKIISLFDGMACGMLAMIAAGIKVSRYVAFEIDKHAVKTSAHNFPIIEHKGDVFNADFTEFSGFDFLVGGSPCTYWSIAQTKNRETVASGLGWDLFSQYVRALHEAKPRFFIYENNKSMSAAIRTSITETFGFEPICINSALVSAQNRQRLYWVGIRQQDGTYKKANVEQPNDWGILLKDILETGAIPLLDKAHTIDATYYKGGTLGGDRLHQNSSRLMAAVPIFTIKGGKAPTMTTRVDGANIKHVLEHGINTMVEEPVCVAQRGRYDESGDVYQHYEAQESGKTNALTTVSKDNLIAEPIKPMYCGIESVNDTDEGVVAMLDMKGQEIIRRVYGTNGKAPTLTTCTGGHREPKIFEKIDKPINAPIYEVKNGLITVKDKQYPIKLADGFYIIRKLTVTECMRLQTVPDWYKWPVSNSQAYKMLGNGWTVEVIAHLIKSIMAETEASND